MNFKIPSVFKNKYFLVAFVTLIWIVFIDNNNLLYQLKLRKQLRELKREKFYYQDEIYRDSLAIKELKENPEALERFAREEYLMKKEGEDIFLIIEED